MYKPDKILIIYHRITDLIDTIYTATKWFIFTGLIVGLGLGFIMALSLWMILHLLLLPLILIHDKILELRR